MNLGTETIIALNASRQYKITGANKSRSAEKLSSGYRINSAADDAAGLSISEKMRKQIRGLDKASQNINDGISYVQVADSALSEVQTMMHRISELSIQAANDTNTAADRLAIDNKVQELKQDINRIFETTEFNTQKIWDTNGNNQVQIGTEPVPAVTSYYEYSSQSFSISDKNKWIIAAPNYDDPATSGYKVSASEADGIKISWTGYDGNQYATTNIPWPSDLAGTTLDIEVGNYLDTTTYPALAGSGINFHLKYNISDVATLPDVINSINDTYINCSPSAFTYANFITTDGITRSSYSKNGVTVSFSSSVSYTAQLAAGRVFKKDYTDTAFIEPSVTQPANFEKPVSDTGNWSADFTLGTATTNSFGGTATSSSTFYNGFAHEPNNPGGRYWWYYDKDGFTRTPSHSPTGNNGTPKSAENALITPGSSNYPISSTTLGGMINIGYNIAGNYNLPIGTYSSIGNLNMYLRVQPNTTLDDIKQVLDDIATVDVYASGLGTAWVGNITPNTVTLDKPIYESEIALNIQTSDVAFDHMSISYRSLRIDNLGLKDTNTKTYEDAQKAIAATAEALAKVSDQCSLFGAYQNRLESAHNTVGNTGENVQSAESRLRDTDMAEEMVRYSKENILAQAGEAMIAQSNSRLSQALTLLQSS